MCVELGGGLRPPSEPPPRMQCEPQDGSRLDPTRPRRASEDCAGKAGARAAMTPDEPAPSDSSLRRSEPGALGLDLGELLVELLRPLHAGEGRLWVILGLLEEGPATD